MEKSLGQIKDECLKSLDDLRDDICALKSAIDTAASAIKNAATEKDVLKAIEDFSIVEHALKHIEIF